MGWRCCKLLLQRRVLYLLYEEPPFNSRAARGEAESFLFSRLYVVPYRQSTKIEAMQSKQDTQDHRWVMAEIRGGMVPQIMRRRARRARCPTRAPRPPEFLMLTTLQ